MKFPFLKMHGAANDFVVVDHRQPFLPAASEALFARLCDRRRGVGADGILLLETHPELDFTMRYFNADGRPAEFCGNGARCLARLALDLGLGRDGIVRFQTDAGFKAAGRSGDAIELHFGRVAAVGEPERIEAAGREFTGRLIQAGVPHFVIEVADVASVPIEAWAPSLRRHPRFGPAGANVDFAAPRGSPRRAMRTWERGVEGETLACGSGAIATALAAAADGAGSPITILTAGGDELVVSFRDAEGGWDVRLIGPAEVAFAGTWTETTPATVKERA
jgi:diaminopimelate epimerase